MRGWRLLGSIRKGIKLFTYPNASKIWSYWEGIRNDDILLTQAISEIVIHIVSFISKKAFFDEKVNFKQ